MGSESARHSIVLAALLASSVGCRSVDRTSGPGRATAAQASDGGSRSDASGDGSAVVTIAGESFVVRSWSFDTARTSFTLADLGMHASLTDALGDAGLVAINAGFFDPDGHAVGFAVSRGKVLSKYSATMSGGVFFTVDGVAHVAATEEFDPRQRVDLAVQCRPRLVVQGRANVRGDDGQRAERTALCVRDAGRAVDIVIAEPVRGTRGPSLFALGQFLAEQRHCDDALNLDGGPSTGVAYRVGDAGTANLLRPRGPLRYALVMR